MTELFHELLRHGPEPQQWAVLIVRESAQGVEPSANRTSRWSGNRTIRACLGALSGLEVWTSRTPMKPKTSPVWLASIQDCDHNQHVRTRSTVLT